jgi:heptosyltransferase I
MRHCRFNAIDGSGVEVNILIVRVSSLGDVVHNMPMVADILHRYPDAHIDWVVEEGYTSLVRLNAGVRHVIPFALRRWRKSLFAASTRAEMRDFYRRLRAESYDIVFDTQGLLKTGVVMQMARLAPGGQRVGLANGTEGSGYEGASRIFHTMSVPVGLRTHGVLRGRLVAAAALGYTVDAPADFNLSAPDLPQHPAWLPDQPYAAFFHATARASKQWAPSNWVELARLLHARGLPVLLAWGSEAEKQAAQQLAGQMPNAHVLPKLSMMEAVAFAQRAALAVGVDTGLTHIAAAYRRPTIELYCDSPRWKTEGDWSPNIVNLGDLGTPPSVAEVVAGVTALLEAPSDHSSTAC